jgi:DNA-binding MarR family transcriptional regulator
MSSSPVISGPLPKAFTPVPTGESPLLERVGYLLAKTHVQMRERANAMLEPLRLDVMQFGALTVLDDAGPLSQQALAARIGCDRTTMVAIIDRLEASGYVKRRRNPEDRRAYALEITKRGAEAQTKGLELLTSFEGEFLAPLSAKERDSLRDMLRRLLLEQRA